MKEITLDEKVQFIYNTQPKGGVSFRDDFFNRFGDGYRTAIHILATPTIMTEFWLQELVKVDETIVMKDSRRNAEIEYKKKVGESVREFESRWKKADRAGRTTEADELAEERDLLRNLSQSLRTGEQIDQCLLRIFTHGVTLEQLEKQVNEILVTISASGYEGTVLLGEQKEEWQALFLPLEAQEKLRNHRTGMDIQAEALGLGFAYNQTYLSDETGFYYGYTRTGGTVYWDLFYKSSKRLYYNLFLAGDMGSGKSTILKKILRDNAAKGHCIRGFDKSGEFFEVVKEYGGVSIPLDGSGGILNMFQVYPLVSQTVNGQESATVDVRGSFMQHISMLGVLYRILNKQASANQTKVFEDLVWDFYMNQGLWKEDESIDITALPNEAYPTVSDFLSYVEQLEREGDEEKADYLKDIKITIRPLTKQHKRIFDGKTTVPDLGDQQIAFFDIAGLSQFGNEIFDCQLFLALNNIMGNLMRIGKREKDLFDRKKKHWWDITRSLVIADEVHNILNIEKAYAAKWFVTLMSEARKFFIGLALATQRVERMFPNADNAQDRETVEAANKLKEVFGLTQYKIILKQDSTSLKFLKQIFGQVFTDTEYEMMSRFETSKEIGGSQGILNIAGDQNLQMTFQVTPEELALFNGGA